MQNEFEKQVQQKMEELKLVPSEPVWQKVEMQIRKKKDRRRLMLWIPLFVLLLGGGLWIGIDQYSNNVSYSRNNNENLNHQTQKENSVTQPGPSITDQTVNEPNKKNLKTKSPVETEKGNHSVTNIKTEGRSFNLRSGDSTRKQSNQTPAVQKNSLVKEQEKHPLAENNETVFTETQPEKTGIITDPAKGNKPADQQILLDSSIKNTSFEKRTDSLVSAEKKEEFNTSKVDSAKTDSASIKQPRLKKYAVAKWKLAFAVSSGVSGLGRLNVFKGYQSMDYASAPVTGATNGGIIYYPPSEVKKGFSFAVQADLKKQLTKRTSFSTGLQYNYYSNSILVGNRIAQNARFGNYSVTQYFSNNRSVFSNSMWQSYHNHYHFVSLPLAIDWQLLKKHPLNVSAGFSLHYLVATNALVFDYNKQAYFYNKDAFNRVQFFSDLGLNYSFRVKESSLAIGPRFQYGISRLEKDNSNHHLSNYGLKVQLQLK